MSRVPEWLLRFPIAHRGLHNASRGVIENSLPAFWAAARAGYPAELDVRLLADGEVVVFHDQNLDRLTNESGPIALRTARDLAHVFLAGAASDDDPNPDDARIPLLRDVLDLIAGSTPLLIEVKNEGDVGALEDAVVKLLASYRGAHAVQSFHPGTVRYWRTHAANTPRGLLAGDFRDEKIDEKTRERLRNMDSIDECDPDFIGYDIRLLPNEPVSRAIARGLPVLGWTARALSDAQYALTHCDNVIFEGFDATQLRTKK
ncbi:MAG TPA: glycerophosphodiester phosphodiesterase family protein [Candidatus Krumholzibacteria bacterium]|nr:glycerophosphodiester phosphodiesterase family protein [Candidatus Krumholzibacteria bacterium]